MTEDTTTHVDWEAAAEVEDLKSDEIVVADIPVSASDAPISLAVDEADTPSLVQEPITIKNEREDAMTVLDYGEIQIIGTPDRIEIVGSHIHDDEGYKPPEPQPLTQSMADQIALEQQAGRDALARQQEHRRISLAQPVEKSATEIAHEKAKMEPVFRSGEPRQDTLKKSPNASGVVGGV